MQVFFLSLLFEVVVALNVDRNNDNSPSTREFKLARESEHTPGQDGTFSARSFIMNQGNIRETFNKIYAYYLPIPKSLYPDHGPFKPATNLSRECARDVITIHSAFQGSGGALSPGHDRQVWPAKLMDSWGKGEDGIFSGNARWLGFIDQCLATIGVSQDVVVDATTDVGQDVFIGVKTTTDVGQDVFVGVRTTTDVGQEVTTDVSTDVTVNVTFRGQYCLVTALPSKASLVKGILPLQYATCIPSTCTEREYQESLAVQLPTYQDASARCQQYDDQDDDSTWHIAGSAVLLMMILPVVAATVAHLSTKRLPACVKAFSLKENLKKLAETANISTRREKSAMCGIRVLSIAWVIFGHHYIFIPYVAPNPLMIPAMTEPWTFQMVWGATFAVDTFFTLSGLLTTMAIMKTNFCLRPSESLQETKPHLEHGRRDTTISNAGGSSSARTIVRAIRRQGAASTALVFGRTYVSYVAHRLLRITPTLLLVIMYCAGPSLYFVHGPYRKTYQDFYLTNCRKNWWVDLTFASNFLTEKHSCIGTSWYIGADLQLHLVAPFILLPMKLLDYKLLYLLVLVIVFSVVKGSLVVAHGLILAPLLDASPSEMDAYNSFVSYTPYVRAAPFFVGSLYAITPMHVTMRHQCT
ncbi:nose resistant to fluoxetine protein 6-like [Hyalella azteca]|uniref:Nose resistant to fluoxetine protein 6-like n=1 Tax=Hyalella azteca TaxID=294128 RepID=A0A8B7NUZ3_HYAAZ|nr:nose resistant to fluoxetine protein 6-like [Hyalella azteca]